MSLTLTREREREREISVCEEALRIFGVSNLLGVFLELMVEEGIYTRCGGAKNESLGNVEL